MNFYKFYEELLKRIRDRESTIGTRILNGAFDKLEDYKHMVGRLKELKDTESLIVELFKGFESQ